MTHEKKRICTECDAFECIHDQDCCESCAPSLGLRKCESCREWHDKDEMEKDGECLFCSDCIAEAKDEEDTRNEINHWLNTN